MCYWQTLMDLQWVTCKCILISDLCTVKRKTNKSCDFDTQLCPKGITPLLFGTFNNIIFFGTFNGFANWISPKNNTIICGDIQMTQQFSLHDYTIYYSVLLFGTFK